MNHTSERETCRSHCILTEDELPPQKAFPHFISYQLMFEDTQARKKTDICPFTVISKSQNISPKQELLERGVGWCGYGSFKYEQIFLSSSCRFHFMQATCCGMTMEHHNAAA